MLKPAVVKRYLKRQKVLTNEFVETALRTEIDKEGILKDVHFHMTNYAIKGITHLICVLMNFNLILLFISAISVVSPGNLDIRKEILNKISKANVDFMDGLYQTLTGLPLWKIYATAGYKLIANSHRSFDEILTESLEKARNDFKQDAESFHSEHPFMSEIMKNVDLSKQDVTMLAMETFIGGIDAVRFLN